MTAEEAAAYLGYSVKYLYKLNYLRKVPHYKTGIKSVHYFQDELDEFLNRGRVRPDYELEAEAAVISSKMTAKAYARGPR